MIPDLIEKTLISIKMIDGVKCIHYSGYAYYSEDDTNTPYRWLDYTWLICPLDEAIAYGISKWESDNQGFVKQYIENCSEKGIKEIFENTVFPTIEEKSITMDTPCGTYYLI